MGSHAIQKVQAARDAVDRLDWTVRVSTDFYGTNLARVFVSRWDGDVRFYRNANATKPCVSLAANWTNPKVACRFLAPAAQTFEFATHLPHGALDRIDSFRDGGRLFARLEGTLHFVHKSDAPTERTTWQAALAAYLDSGSGLSISSEIVSDSFELTRDLWIDEVLALLRPANRYVVEIRTPTPAEGSETATRAIAHLKEAQLAFDQGRWAEVARTSYRGLEELKKLADAIEERYGQHGKNRLLDQVKNLCSVCNPERHGEEAHHDGLKFDRVLAQHVLASAWSLAGVILSR